MMSLKTAKHSAALGAADYDGVPYNSMFPYIGAYDYAPSARPTLTGMEQ